MKKLVYWSFCLLCLFVASNPAKASSGFSHVISLEPGWNLVSTPRLLSSHEFSASSTSANYDIYVMNPSSASKWSTMAELNQTEFQPLFGYFINNKVGTTTTLTFNYQENVAPNERFFSRNLQAGWNAIGVANPSYALKQKDPDSVDTNNVKSILDSIGSSTQSVYDLTANQTPKYKAKISDSWSNATYNDANNLNDFRETKAYAVYNTSAGVYSGSQNNDPVVTNDPSYEGPINISKKGTSPSDTTVIRGTDSTILLANVEADEALTTDGLNLSYAYTNDNASTTTQFENARVYVNGVLLDSFDPATSTAATIAKAIDSTFTLNKGDNEIKIMVKAKTTAIASSTIYFALASSSIFTNMNPEYVISGNSVSNISGVATSATFTIQYVTLETVRSDGYGSGSAILASSRDVSLGKFTVKANNDIAHVTSVSFGSNLGTTSDTSIYDMKLYVDGSQVGSTIDFGVSGVVFTPLNFNIPEDETKQFELKGSFDSSASGTFQTVMTVNAQDSRGSSIGSGNIATTTNFIITEKGTLSVTLSGNTPPEGMLATKSTEQEVAQFKFTAVNDSANLTEIILINTPLASSTIASTSSGVSNADPRIASVKLYDGVHLIDSFQPVNGTGKFTITNDEVVIPANSNKTLSIKVVLNNIDNDESATNKDIHFGITTAKFKSSNGEVTTQGVALLANNFRLRKTVPTIANQTLPSTLLINGDSVIAKFTVTADSNADVTVGRFALTVTNTASATIATTSNPLKVNGVSKTATADMSTPGTMIINLGAPEVVAAGCSKTFEVYATVGVSGSGTESITTRIIEDTPDYAVGSTVESVPGSFVWSDNASVTVDTYANSHRVPGLSTDAQTLSVN